MPIERMKGESAEAYAKRLEAELAKKEEVYLKVSDKKGGLSIYGLQRFPVTMYREQWLKVLDMADEIRDFIKKHDKELKKKE